MPFSYNVSKEAEDDLLEAYVWYEQQRTGLGEEFLESTDKARHAIILHPQAYSVRHKKKVRSFIVDRFPFLILYVLEKKEVNVVAVFNTSRDLQTWKKRIKN